MPFAVKANGTLVYTVIRRSREEGEGEGGRDGEMVGGREERGRGATMVRWGMSSLEGGGRGRERWIDGGRGGGGGERGRDGELGDQLGRGRREREEEMESIALSESFPSCSPSSSPSSYAIIVIMIVNIIF